MITSLGPIWSYNEFKIIRLLLCINSDAVNSKLLERSKLNFCL